MKQTLEEAAKAFAEKCRIANYKGGLDYPYDDIDMRNAFEVGAEWHAKQSPWINVEERLPEEGQEVIVLYEYVSTLMTQTSFYHKEYEVWCFGDSKIIAWMPIPSFDEILEANRVKEKGD